MYILTNFVQKIKDFFKLFYKSKEKQKTISHPETEIYEDLKKEYKKIIQKKEKDKKSKFKQLVDNLEKNKSKIIKEKEDAKPKIIKDRNFIKYIYKNKTFLFDQEGYDLFNEEFSKPNYLIIVKQGYLLRENKKTGGLKAFHRWFMQKEVESFCVKNNCKEDEVQVHHLDLTTTNNKRENLIAMFIEDHRKLHIMEKFEGSNEEFEEWYNYKN